MSDLPFEPVLAVLRGGPRSHDDVARWIEQQYGVPVVEIVAEPNATGGFGRSTVWVRTRDEADGFRDDYNLDPAKKHAIIDRLGGGGFVLVRAIEPELRQRTLSAIGDNRLMESRTAVSEWSTVWKIYQLFGIIWVWLHTDDEVARFRDSVGHRRLLDSLWSAVHERDEFGIFPRETFEVRLDSKQNLDEHFEGNSYYYHR